MEYNFSLHISKERTLTYEEKNHPQKVCDILTRRRKTYENIWLRQKKLIRKK